MSEVKKYFEEIAIDLISVDPEKLVTGAITYMLGNASKKSENNQN
ncbi:MAG: hypothetical protein ACI4SF_05555 [Oscillospiraceae bacterium]